jgi:hypothetical protein
MTYWRIDSEELIERLGRQGFVHCTLTVFVSSWYRRLIHSGYQVDYIGLMKMLQALPSGFGRTLEEFENDNIKWEKLAKEIAQK